MKILFEINISGHAEQRLKERAYTPKSVVLPDNFYLEGDDKDQIINNIKQQIGDNISKRLNLLKSVNFDRDVNVVYKLGLIKVKRNNRLYTPIITTVKDGFDYVGNLYIVIIRSNKAITILNVPETKNNDSDLENLLARDDKRDAGKSSKIDSNSNLDVIIDLDTIKYETPTPSNLGEKGLKTLELLKQFKPQETNDIQLLVKYDTYINNFLIATKGRLSPIELNLITVKKNDIQDRLRNLSIRKQNTIQPDVNYLVVNGEIRNGKKISHKSFGLGTIISREKIKGTEDAYRCKIDFKDKGIKTMVVKQNKSIKLEPQLNENNNMEDQVTNDFIDNKIKSFLKEEFTRLKQDTIVSNVKSMLKLRDGMYDTIEDQATYGIKIPYSTPVQIGDLKNTIDMLNKYPEFIKDDTNLLSGNDNEITFNFKKV